MILFIQNYFSMKRRTFTKKSAGIGILGIFTPFLSLASQYTGTMQVAVPSVALPHVQQFMQNMCQGAADPAHRDLIEKYATPVRILKFDQRANGYHLAFKNCNHQTITLTADRDRVITRIGA